MQINWNALVLYGGALAGYVSLIIELLSTIFARPKLNFRIERPIHYYHEKDRIFQIYAKINIDNTGERSTTINRMEILTISAEELLDRFNPESAREHHVQPHSSMHIDWHRTIHDTDELRYDDLGITLKIYWTHGSKSISIIVKPRD